MKSTQWIHDDTGAIEAAAVEHPAWRESLPPDLADHMGVIHSGGEGEVEGGGEGGGEAEGGGEGEGAAPLSGGRRAEFAARLRGMLMQARRHNSSIPWPPALTTHLLPTPHGLPNAEAL